MEVVHSSPCPLFLHLLPPELFSLVAQFLPLPDKLLHLTHVCRTFPPLTPQSFACDTLAWTPMLLFQLSTSFSAALQSLLSLIPSALFVEPSDCPSLPALTDLLSCSDSPSPPPSSPFPALRAVTLAPLPSDGPDSEVKEPTDSRSPIIGLSLCPHLTVLNLSIPQDPHLDRSTYLLSLLLLRSLHTLRLQAKLSADDFLLLLSIPLGSLDLFCSDVVLTTPPPTPFPSLHLLQTLLLPNQREGVLSPVLTPMSELWHRALLSSLSTPQVGGEVRLERLSIWGTAPSHLSYIPLFPRLQTLQLTTFYAQEEEEQEREVDGEGLDLCNLLLSARLPLRHLSLRQNDHRVEWSPAVLPAFICAYAEQLLSLNLCHRVDWRCCEVFNAQLKQAITAALLSCHSLCRLQVTDRWMSSILPPSPSPCLPRLNSLQLDVATTIDENTLAVLLDQSPHLQELTLHSGSPLPFNLLVWAGDRCHELTTFEMTADVDPHMIQFRCPFDFERWQSLPPSPALPLLTTLIMRSPALHKDPGARAWAFLNLAAYLVHSTPSLRYLHIPQQQWLQEDPQLLSRLVGLTQLRGLHLELPTQWMQDTTFERHRCWRSPDELTSSKGARTLRETCAEGDTLWGQDALPRQRRQWREEHWAEELRMRAGARSEEAVWAACERWMPLFREEVAGMTGARAFFTACQSICPGCPSWRSRVGGKKKRRREEENGNTARAGCREQEKVVQQVGRARGFVMSK